MLPVCSEHGNFGRMITQQQTNRSKKNKRYVEQNCNRPSPATLNSLKAKKNSKPERKGPNHLGILDWNSGGSGFFYMVKGVISVECFKQYLSFDTSYDHFIKF